MNSPEAPKPIPVTYDGITYRSALEADWGATFTDLGIFFEYEPQPYRLPSGAVYDCDFYLPTTRTYCEAKGPHNNRLWKPIEFAAVLAALEYPRAFQVLILRPAGPRGEAVWEQADPMAETPLLVYCFGCLRWCFTDTDTDDRGGVYCRCCYGSGNWDDARRSGGADEHGWRGTYLDMRRAPRWKASS